MNPLLSQILHCFSKLWEVKNKKKNNKKDTEVLKIMGQLPFDHVQGQKNQLIPCSTHQHYHADSANTGIV